jgi:Fe-S cluster assembly protein SufB
MAATDTKSTAKDSASLPNPSRIAKPSPIVEDEQGQLVATRGISRGVIEELSKIKGEPDWMRKLRVESFGIFERKPVPTWGVDLSDLDLDELVLYSPPEAGRFDDWDDVPADIKQTYEDLGIPQAEREHLAGVVGTWRQEPVYESLKKEYSDLGIIFTSMDTAVTEHEDLVREYFMTRCVPAGDNKFSALHGAVWSGGSFLYVPKGVKVDLPLQAYFRMEGANEGTFEHTLIIADEGSEVNYIEGCTAQTYSVNSMHSAVVEIFVKEGAKARYTTVQNWSKDVFNLNTKRARVEANGTVEWVGGSMGAKKVMLYPGSILDGEGARADHLNVGVASGDVWKDTGAKVLHMAPNTTSNILAKSISKDGGIMGYRGLVKMGPNSQGSKAHVQCDGLMMDEYSRSDTWPDIQIQNPHVTVAHEAVVGKISDEQLFYLQSRGLSEEEAAAMIVNGFIEPVTKELPMEYAVELNRLIQLEMVGSIG